MNAILFTAGVILGGMAGLMVIFAAEWVRTVGVIHAKDSDVIVRTLAKIENLGAREANLTYENRRLRIRLAELQAELKRCRLHGNDEESGDP